MYLEQKDIENSWTRYSILQKYTNEEHFDIEIYIKMKNKKLSRK
jgi:hypothetical protein